MHRDADVDELRYQSLGPMAGSFLFTPQCVDHGLESREAFGGPRVRDTVAAPRVRDAGRLGADREAYVEPTVREMINGDGALGEPRDVVGGTIERIGHGGTDATPPRLQCQRGQQRPAVVRPLPEAITVGHPRVTQRVGGRPISPKRGDVRAPCLHADGDHRGSIRDGARACQTHAV